LCGWGDIFIPQFDLVVFLCTSAAIRKERLKKREYERFGERIRKGGDMYDEHTKFIEWAMQYDAGDINMRSMKLHEEWLKQLSCPIIKLNGADNCEDNLIQLGEFLA